MPLDKPVLFFYVGFTAGVYDPISTITWTEITSDVLSWSTERGRQQELGRFDPGKLTVRLNNRDRRFDPTNAASPYHPNLLPMRRIGVVAIYGATYEDVFHGYVKGWPPSWTSAATSEVTIQCVDALGGPLTLPQLDNSAWATVVRKDNPTAWYRLGETSGAAPDHSGNGYDGQYQGPEQMPQGVTGVDGLVAGDPDKAFHPNRTLGEGIRVSVPHKNIIGGYPFQIECLLRCAPDPAPTSRQILTATSDPIDAYQALDLAVDDNVLLPSTPGRVRFFIRNAGVSRAVYSSVRVDDTQTHHVVVKALSATDFRIFVDDVDVTVVHIGGAPAFPNDLPNGYSIGNVPASTFGDRSFATQWADVLDEVLIYSGTTLAAARITAHRAAAANGWGGETSGVRIQHALEAAVDWPVADRALDVGVALLGPVLNAGSLLAYMQQVEATEDGALFVDAAGKVTFHSRHRQLLSPNTTSQATFGPNAGEIPYEGPLQYGLDEGDLYNEMKGQRLGGAPQHAEDAASIASYGRRALPAADNLLSLDDNEVRDLVHWKVARHAQPVARVRTLRVHPAAIPTVAYPKVLSLKLRDRVTVKITPPGGGPTFTQESHIERIAHDVDDKGDWVTTFSLSAAEVQSFWIMGISALGIGTRLAA